MKREEKEKIFKCLNVVPPSYTGSMFPGGNSEIKILILSFVQFQQDELMPSHVKLLQDSCTHQIQLFYLLLTFPMPGLFSRRSLSAII